MARRRDADPASLQSSDIFPSAEPAEPVLIRCRGALLPCRSDAYGRGHLSVSGLVLGILLGVNAGKGVGGDSFNAMVEDGAIERHPTVVADFGGTGLHSGIVDAGLEGVVGL